MTNLEEDYLNKDFDYTKLTMPKLKKILFENGCYEIPHNVKKQQLLEIYRENIYDKIDEIKKKKKKEQSREKNKYQSDRSSIMELEPNDNDEAGGIFTNGRTRRASSGFPQPDDVPVEERLKVIKNGTGRRGSLNTDEPKENEKRPKSTSPVRNPPQNTSFLDSIGTYLKNSSKREALTPTKEMKATSPVKKAVSPVKKAVSPVKKGSTPNKKETTHDKKETTHDKKETTHDKKKIYLDVNTSDFSNTSFFSYQTNKDTTPKKERKQPEKVKGTSKKTFTCLLPLFGIVVMAISYVVYRCLPFCTNGQFFCINIPENGRIENGKLVCNKGFRLKTSLFRDACVKDDTKEVQMLRTIRTILKKLEIIRGNYVYGFTKTYKTSLDQITTDMELIQVLKHTPGVVIEDGSIYSTNYRTTLRVFFKFYSTKAFYFLIPLLLLVLFVHFFQKHRVADKERRSSSKKIVKEVLNILLRQLIMSTKNTRFPSYVYVDQLRDVFVVEAAIWKMVKANVESNSNVRKDVIDKKEIWEWVGPLIQSTDNYETLVA